MVIREEEQQRRETGLEVAYRVFISVSASQVSSQWMRHCAISLQILTMGLVVVV